MYIDIKRYPPGTKDSEIMDDWQTNEKLALWASMYTDPSKILIKEVEQGWKSLGILIDD